MSGSSDRRQDGAVRGRFPQHPLLAHGSFQDAKGFRSLLAETERQSKPSGLVWPGKRFARISSRSLTGKTGVFASETPVLSWARRLM